MAFYSRIVKRESFLTTRSFHLGVIGITLFSSYSAIFFIFCKKVVIPLVIPNLLEHKDFQCNFIIIIHDISHSFIFHIHSHHSIFIHNISNHLEIPKYLESSKIFGKFQNIRKVPNCLSNNFASTQFQSFRINPIPIILDQLK